MTLVFIDGAAGTTGLEIRERLEGRTDVRLLVLDEQRRKDAGARRDALNSCDIAILCLPDDAARDAVGLIDNRTTRVIDASTAHRTADGWTYGFPELGFDVASARFVSNPGCYPTGFLALVAPLVRAGLVPADTYLTINATSGYSGGGKAMIAEFEDAADPPAFRAYALDLAHKHVGEMTRHAGLAHPVLFQPAVANTLRGMVVEVPLQLGAIGDAPLHALHDTLAAAFTGPVVRVAADREATIAIGDDAGTDRMTLHVRGHAGQARLVATLDNLGKGASGAAVQSLNLMAGLDPYAGLTL